MELPQLECRYFAVVLSVQTVNEHLARAGGIQQKRKSGCLHSPYLYRCLKLLEDLKLQQRVVMISKTALVRCAVGVHSPDDRIEFLVKTLLGVY